LLESFLKWAWPDEAETSQEDRSNGRKSQRLAQQERLDNHDHQSLRGDQPLPRIVAGLLAKLIDNRRRERARNAASTASPALDLGAGFFAAARVILFVIGVSWLSLVEQKQLAALPIYFHHPATLRTKDLGMG